MRYLVFIPYLVIFVGLGSSYSNWLPAMVGWVLSALGVLFGLGLAVTIIFTKLSVSLWSAAIASLPAMIAIPMVINDLRYPRINDISTNIKNPPFFVAALNAVANQKRDMSFPEKNGEIICERYPNVRPLLLEESLEQVFQRIETLAKIQFGWAITRSDTTTYTLEGEVTTSLFRFVDDFVITVSEQEGKALINMRSKSRDGLVDTGKNAQRIQMFFEQLETSKATGTHIEGRNQ